MATPRVPLKLVKRRAPQRVKCIAYPNRTKRQLFTAKKAGDIVCRVLKQAEHSPQVRAELRKQLDRCFPCTETDKDTERKLAEARAVATNALTETSKVIAIALAVLAALFVLPRILPLLPRAVLALIPSGARIAISQVGGLMARLRARQAANDAAFRLISGL